MVTVEGHHLDSRYFEVVGAENMPIVVGGMEGQSEFCRAVRDDEPGLNPAHMVFEIVHVVRKIMTQLPDIHSLQGISLFIARLLTET